MPHACGTPSSPPFLLARVRLSRSTHPTGVAIACAGLTRIRTQEPQYPVTSALSPARALASTSRPGYSRTVAR